MVKLTYLEIIALADEHGIVIRTDSERLVGSSKRIGGKPTYIIAPSNGMLKITLPLDLPRECKLEYESRIGTTLEFQKYALQFYERPLQ